MLWLCGICVPATVFIVIFATGDTARILCLLFASPVVFASVYYGIILAFAPDRLHSEKHQLALRRIAVMGDSRTGPLLDQPPTSNPALEDLRDDR